MNLRQLKAVAEALGFRDAGADDGLVDWDALKDAREEVFAALQALRHGGKVVVLTKAELREVRLAAGQATDDADWYKHQRNPRERRALLSAADKLGFFVVTK